MVTKDKRNPEVFIMTAYSHKGVDDCMCGVYYHEV
jgi:hypothetical protein